MEAVGFPVQNVYKMTYGDENATFEPLTFEPVNGYSMTFNAAALFNHILSIIPLPDAIVSGHPTGFRRSNNRIPSLGGTKDKTLFVRQLTIKSCVKNTRNLLQCPESQ
ncbi:MAG: hypothetical protein ABIN18_09365 [Pseudomonadota bacterium]